MKWASVLGLPMINILNPDGTINSEGGPYEGCTIPEARKRVVADLESLGLLGDVEDRDIELPLSDRSKTPIEPYLADQWFVAMDELAQSAMDAVTDERVKIFPERYRKGYLDWLSEKRDWPVSRQLWWGHRIPSLVQDRFVRRRSRTSLCRRSMRSRKAADTDLSYRVDPADDGTPGPLRLFAQRGRLREKPDSKRSV